MSTAIRLVLLVCLAGLLLGCSSSAATPQPAARVTQAPEPAPVRVVEDDEPIGADEQFMSFEELIAAADCEQLPALAQVVLDDQTIPSSDALAIVDAIAAAERRKGC